MSTSNALRAAESGASLDSPHFQAALPTFKRLTRSRKLAPMMAWARSRSLDEDLQQLGLIELAKLLQKFDPGVGTTVEQYVGSTLPARMVTCLRSLNRDYCDRLDQAAADHGLDSPEEDGDDSIADHEDFVSTKPACESSIAGDATGMPDDDAFAFEIVGDAAANALEWKRVMATLHREIERLPSRQAEVVRLGLADYTDGEIAQHLEISKQAVSKAKQKAVAVLSQAIRSAMH